MSRLPLRCFALLGLLGVVLAAVPALIAQAPVHPISHEKIIRYVRDRFSIPDTVKITMTELRESAYPDFLETTVTVDDGKDKRSQALFISKNMRYLVEGSIFNLGGDPRQDIVRLISLRDQPTQGPANAPVTLVEYSDLECPVCARLHEELETEIIPKYGDKLRVVFKEFPLVTIHEWALTGAIAAQCTYQIDPSKYVDFRSAIYKNQATVSGDHARDLLLHIAAEAGVDNMKLAACIDAKDSLSRVEANMREGDALGVGQTPTTFINGRTIVGAPAAADFYKLIDEAMHDHK
ncbi:MAG: DsbA family protein [Acidobacteriota bacterium]|nr:DsbA family protein [Acidobacteriota bacterium]